MGPTTTSDLKPEEKKEVILKAESKGFTRWSAHPEMVSNENGEKGKEEHGEEGEGKGEHN